MAVQAFISGAATIWTTASDLLGGGKDAERRAANQAAYQAALNGDANALLFLKQRTGMYGTAFVSGYGSIGGWATDEAKDDARIKYNAVLNAIAGQELAGQAGSFVQGIAQQTGHTIVPGTKESITLVLVIGGALIAALAMRAARRGR